MDTAATSRCCDRQEAAPGWSPGVVEIAGPMSGAGDPSTLRHRDEHTVAFQRDGPAIIGIAASAVDEQGLACRLAHDSLVLRAVEVEGEPRSTVRIFHPAKVPFGSAEMGLSPDNAWSGDVSCSALEEGIRQVSDDDMT